MNRRSRCTIDSVRWLALIGLVGCNQIFGLDPTILPPVDAPSSCPAVGTPPAFGKALQTATLQDCESYTTAATGRALAMCNEPQASYLAEGPTAGSTGDAVLESLKIDGVSDPRVSPEGDELFVRHTTAVGTRIGVFVRQADSTWMFDHDLALPLTANDKVGTLSRGPSRRMLVTTVGVAWLNEYIVERDGTTTLFATHTAMMLQAGVLQNANISADGLRVVFFSSTASSDGNRQFYADRESLELYFRTAKPLENAPRDVAFASMTEDCSRLYFSALGQVFYMSR